jgi:hypothetical protein
MAPVHRLRVLVFQELPHAWVAQVVEYDIAAGGPTPDGAVEAVVRILQAHIDFDRRHNREPLSGFQAAPRRYWNALAHAIPLGCSWRHDHPHPDIPAEITAVVLHERFSPAPPLAVFRPSRAHRMEERERRAEGPGL